MKKRIFSILTLLALLLSVTTAFTACFDDPAENDGESESQIESVTESETETEKETERETESETTAADPNYPQRTIKITENLDKIKIYGRYTKNSTEVTVGWSASGIEFKADCKGDVTVKFISSAYPLLSQ